ncbi:MAG: VIT domain-containing protein, partial [Pyramidobacter sp.]|nr:VIT domain-containing protein [Pyramidobacter sp.]
RGEAAGTLAQVCVEMTLYNPNSRDLEGELCFPLRGDQTVTGFALDFDGEMRPAVPVEKQKGRHTFEKIVRSKSDPALLEKTEGNNFRVRVYPVAAGKTRRVSVTYTETLRRAVGQKVLWNIPLNFGAVPECSVELRLVGAQNADVVRSPFDRTRSGMSVGAYTVSASGALFAQGCELELAFDVHAADCVLGRRDGQTYFYAEIPCVSKSAQTPRKVTVLWDASMSALKRDRDAELAFLDSLLGRLNDAEITLVIARNAEAQTRTFARGEWKKLRPAIESEVCDGATALEKFNTASGADMYLLFSDGIDTYSAGAMKTPDAPLFSVISAPGCDTDRLRGLSWESGGDCVSLTGCSADDAAARVLTFQPARVAVRGADGVSVRRDGDCLAVSGRLKGAAPEIVILDTEGERAVTPDVSSAPQSDMVPLIWASMRIESLSREYRLNAAEIRRVGKAFGLASRETSLIVLDTAEDYVRYDIEPPASLKKDADALRAKMPSRAQTEKNKLQRVAQEWKEYQTWWNRDFPKGKYTPPKNQPPHSPQPRLFAGLRRMHGGLEAIEDSLNAVEPTGSSSEVAPQKSEGAPVPRAAAVIRLQPWRPDTPYRARMTSAKTEDLYRIYLDERPDFMTSAAFFLDVSDILAQRGLSDLALRVLSNLAEMKLDSPQILRLLGRRLMQTDCAGQAVTVFRRVLEIERGEPQSFRDLGLALERAGRAQEAAEMLYETVRLTFDRVFPGIEVIALSELNALLARNPSVNTSFMDRQFIAPMPLDLRVVLSWDTDNTDIDLHVIDPNGEEAFYAHPLTYQGGRVSPDNTQGYGPEDYSLKKAKPGVYRVEVNFYGHSQQIISESTAIQLDFFTDWGRENQKRQSVTMRLKEKKERIFVGEFEVK